jgi:hypothetical protein
MQQQSGLIFELIKIFNIIISTLLIELDNRGSMFKTVKHMKQPNATWLGALFMWTTRSNLVFDNSRKKKKKQKEHKNNIFSWTKTKFNVWRVTLWLLLLYSTFKRVSFPLRFFISIYPFSFLFIILLLPLTSQIFI